MNTRVLDLAPSHDIGTRRRYERTRHEIVCYVFFFFLRSTTKAKTGTLSPICPVSVALEAGIETRRYVTTDNRLKSITR